MKIVFIGYGNMGRALGEAWKNEPGTEVLAVDPAFTSLHDPQGYSSVHALMDSGRGVDVDIVVLAVKPALAASALQSLPAEWGNRAILVSVAAGVSLSSLAIYAPAGIALVRVMPNTPSQLGAGCTALVAAPGVNAEMQARLQALFEVVGTAHWLEQESHIDMVTAISGSGPAYYHLFTEALSQAGQAVGLPAELAQQLATQTAWGAAMQQHQPAADVIELRRAVTSPNGTTAAAIQVFELDHALRQLVDSAVRAAHQRAIELAAN